jgi:hypothetical protein
VSRLALARLCTCTALKSNVNCVISKEIIVKGERIPTLFTLIKFLMSFMSFKKTDICECFSTFVMSLVFIYIISSFRFKKGTRTKEGFPHYLLPLGLFWVSFLMSMKDTRRSVGCFSFLALIVSLQSEFTFVNVTGNCSYP